MCRTYVFATDATPRGILDALRAHRTVVYGEKGRVYGDPSLVQLAATQPALRQQAVVDSAPSALDVVSRFFGLAGLASLVLTRNRTSAV